MNSPLGVYWSVMHRRPQDYDYFKRLQPSVFKIMDGGASDYQFARDHLPNSLVIARDWALSEQHSDMLKDPVSTGQRHAREWTQHQVRLGFDRTKTLILGINEPHVWEPGVPEALRQYTIAMCDEATRLGLRVGAMQFSVGWPANTGPDTPPDWSPYHGLEDAIKRGNHMLVTHEYWADNGPGENWGWWAGRSLKCPWQVPIVIGECGVDMYVKDGSVAHAQRGWQGRMAPERYAAELAEYVSRMSADKRFVGACVFASDFANREWFSFDLERAYDAILSTPIPQPAKPVETHLPAIGNEKTVGQRSYVAVPAGANLRGNPYITNGNLLLTLPFGEEVEVNQTVSDGQWSQVRYQSVSGFIKSDLLSREPVIERPQIDMRSNWDRAWPIVLEIEGGLSLDPNDSGNYYQGRLIGTKYGISAAVWGGQYDIPNLTQDEALAIYRKHYWDAAGCDKLPWPMCLIHFDTAVQHGVGVANELLNSMPTREQIYLGMRALRYMDDPKWRLYGEAWGVRVDHLQDLAKEGN